MGNVIATYSGGYQQHIYMGSSIEKQIWGNDREVMTFDNAGTNYFGPVLHASSDGLTITVPSHPRTPHNQDNIVGGVMVVVNGSGAGQYRRVTSSFEGTQFTIDRPLAVPVDKDGMIEVMPLRGRNIFDREMFDARQNVLFADHLVLSRLEFACRLA